MASGVVGAEGVRPARRPAVDDPSCRLLTGVAGQGRFWRGWPQGRAGVESGEGVAPPGLARPAVALPPWRLTISSRTPPSECTVASWTRPFGSAGRMAKHPARQLPCHVARAGRDHGDS